MDCWLQDRKAELKDFTSKLEEFISDTGFNTSKFETTVALGLQKKEEEVRKTFIDHDEN